MIRALISSPARLFTLVLGIYTLIQIPGLANAPPVGGDEAWTAGLARAWRADGRLRNPMFDQIWPERLAVLQDAQMCNGWVWYITGLGVWTRLVGEDLRSQRLSSWLTGSGAIALTYVVAGWFGGPAAGRWAAAILATRSLYWASSRMVRPDTGMALLILAAFALWLRATESSPGGGSRDRGRPAVALVAGVAAGLAPGFHANGIILAPALLLASLWRRPSRTAVLAMSAGWFAATLGLADRIQIGDVAAGWSWEESGWRMPPILRSAWHAVAGTLTEPFAHLKGELHVPPDPDFRRATMIELAALYPALAAAWTVGARPLVVFTGSLLLMSSCLNGLKRAVYLTYFYPLFAVALGILAANLRDRMASARREPGGGGRLWLALPVGLAFLWGLAGRPPLLLASVLLILWTAARSSLDSGSAFRRAIPVVSLAVLVVMLVGGAGAAAYVAGRALLRARGNGLPYDELKAEVRAAVPAGARVFGPHWLWFTLRDHDYRDSTALMETGWWRRGRLEDHLGRFRPDVIIADDGLRGMFFQRHLPRVTGWLDLRPELTRPHRLVARVQGGWPYGMVEVFLVRW